MLTPILQDILIGLQLMPMLTMEEEGMTCSLLLQQQLMVS